VEVFIDGSRVEEGFSQGNLKEALLHLQSSLCAPTQIVVGIRCDGQDVPGSAMADVLDKPADTFVRVDVLTSTKEKLVTETMGQAAASLQETETACEQVVAMLTEGKTSEAIEMLGDCLRIWQQIHDAVAKSIQMLDLDLTEVTIKDEPMLDVITQPKETLVQIKQALQAQDYVLLADVLQYEFGNVTDRWYLLIARLRQEAEDRSGR